MFERFTDRARRVMVLAQEEAGTLNHADISTGHLVLGLLREGDGVAGRALASSGVTLEAARCQLEVIDVQKRPTTSGDLSYTPKMEKILREGVLREALQLGHNFIGTEHLLLALLRKGDGAGARVLINLLDVDLNSLRQRVLQLLQNQTAKTSTHPIPEMIVKVDSSMTPEQIRAWETPPSDEKWRIYVVDPERSHHITSHRNFGYGYSRLCPPDSDTFASHEFPNTEFDELVVGRWCHIEAMDDNYWWMNIGGVTLHVTTDQDGRPTVVRVDGPGGDWDSAAPGCTYECMWPQEP